MWAIEGKSQRDHAVSTRRFGPPYLPWPPFGVTHYNGIGTALDDLEAGRIGLVIKLFPVISWLTRERSDLAVAMQVPTHEKLGIAYAADRNDLCNAVDIAIEALRESGEFAKLQAAWLDTGTSL